MLSRRLLAGIVVAIGILSVPADRVAFAQNDPYAAWERVLANYVDSEGLIDYAGKWGELRFDGPDAIAESDKHIIVMLQLVVTTQEYQMV